MRRDKATYRLFLSSPEWQLVRNEVRALNREHNQGELLCSLCQRDLDVWPCEVHHIRYDGRFSDSEFRKWRKYFLNHPRATVWPEGWLATQYLVCLDPDCHREQHGIKTYRIQECDLRKAG